MKLALVGATGIIGSKVLVEASNRGHEITAIVRNPGKVPPLPGTRSRKADILDKHQAAESFAGHDVVVSCFNAGHHPAPGQNVYMDIIDGAVSLIQATKASGVNRLLFVGGASALFVRPGTQLLDIMPAFARGEVKGTEFPEDIYAAMPPEFALWKNVLPDEAGSDHIRPLVHVLMFLEHDQTFDWSFFSPPAGLHPGPRTGRYTLGANQVPMNGETFAGLSIEDAAIALVDEVENNAQCRRHWTAYTP
jgi:uncharacterized protein